MSGPATSRHGTCRHADHLQTWDMPTLEMVGPTRCYTPSCVLLLFIFFLPYIESFAVSESRLPSSLVPVSVVPVVPSFPLLLVSPVLPLVLAPGGLAGVLPLALPQPLRPVSLVPAAISKLLIVRNSSKGFSDVQ